MVKKPIDPSWMTETSDPLMLAAFAYLNGDEDCEEKEARRAIAVLLRRRPVDEFLCEMLSLVFDPDIEWPRMAEVKFRKLGRRPNRRRDLLIGLAIHKLVGDGNAVESAVFAVADEASLSPEAVWKIWAHVKDETKPFHPHLTVVK